MICNKLKAVFLILFALTFLSLENANGQKLWKRKKIIRKSVSGHRHSTAPGISKKRKGIRESIRGSARVQPQGNRKRKGFKPISGYNYYKAPLETKKRKGIRRSISGKQKVSVIDEDHGHFFEAPISGYEYKYPVTEGSLGYRPSNSLFNKLFGLQPKPVDYNGNPRVVYKTKKAFYHKLFASVKRKKQNQHFAYAKINKSKAYDRSEAAIWN